MIGTKLNLLPKELLNYIWNFEGTREERYNKCVSELNVIFNRFNKAYSTAFTLDYNQKYRMIWPLAYMNSNPTEFLYTYKNKEHRYFLKKIRENVAFQKAIKI
tara:strand:+ start:395 stop:703 length:309 start_codon:yes stop_codon:yes gene_type:complete